MPRAWASVPVPPASVAENTLVTTAGVACQRLTVPTYVVAMRDKYARWMSFWPLMSPAGGGLD